MRSRTQARGGSDSGTAELRLPPNAHFILSRFIRNAHFILSRFKNGPLFDYARSLHKTILGFAMGWIILIVFLHATVNLHSAGPIVRT